jgi:hypothetical protein
MRLRGTIGAILSRGSLNGRTATRYRPPPAAAPEPRQCMLGQSKPLLPFPGVPVTAGDGQAN